MGFAGVGTMGFHMASNLLRAGLRLVVYDTNDAAADRLSAMGASISGSPAQLAATPGELRSTQCCCEGQALPAGHLAGRVQTDAAHDPASNLK